MSKILDDKGHSATDGLREDHFVHCLIQISTQEDGKEIDLHKIGEKIQIISKDGNNLHNSGEEIEIIHKGGNSLCPIGAIKTRINSNGGRKKGGSQDRYAPYANSKPVLRGGQQELERDRTYFERPAIKRDAEAR